MSVPIKLIFYEIGHVIFFEMPQWQMAIFRNNCFTTSFLFENLMSLCILATIFFLAEKRNQLSVRSNMCFICQPCHGIF